MFLSELSKYSLLKLFLILQTNYKLNNYEGIYSLPGIKELSSKFFDKNVNLMDITKEQFIEIFSLGYESSKSLKKIFSFLRGVSECMQVENLQQDYLSKVDEFIHHKEVGEFHYHIATMSAFFGSNYITTMSAFFGSSYRDESAYDPTILCNMYEVMNHHNNIAFEHFMIAKNMKPGFDLIEHYYPVIISNTFAALSDCDESRFSPYYKNALSYLRKVDNLYDREHYVNSLIKKIGRFESKETRISLLNELLEDINQRINSGSAYEEDINLSNEQLRKINFVYSKLEVGNSDVKAILSEWESSNYESGSEHEEESEYDTEAGSNSDANTDYENNSDSDDEEESGYYVEAASNTDGNYEYDVETGSSKIETAQLKLESPNVGIFLGKKTSPSLLIGNGETNRPYQITSQDTYYAGYFFSKVFLKPLIQCKNNEYKTVNNSSIENSYDYTTCVMNETFNGKNLIGALVAPSIHLINKGSSPAMILLNAASIHLLYAVYSEDYVSYATDLVLQTFSNFILGYSSFLLMQQNNYVPQDNFLQASLTGVLTPIATDLFKLGNNFLFNDDGNIHG